MRNVVLILVCKHHRKEKEQNMKHDVSRRASYFMLFTKHSRDDAIKKHLPTGTCNRHRKHKEYTQNFNRKKKLSQITPGRHKRTWEDNIKMTHDNEKRLIGFFAGSCEYG